MAAAVLMPQPPGHELGEADPETVEGLVEWLRTLQGDSATEAEQYAAILGADGVTCLRDLILNESEMIAIHIPRVIARRICEGRDALFRGQGWYLAQAPQQVNPHAIAGAAVAGVAPARVRSGQIAPLPKIPAFDEAGLIDRDDAIKKMHDLLAWVRGWGNSLAAVMLVMIEHPNLTYAQVMSHGNVLANPPDRDDDIMYASCITSQWDLDVMTHVTTTTIRGDSGVVYK